MPELTTRNPVMHRPDPLPMRVRERTLDFSVRTWVMGVVNVTPDSFSDGGAFLDPGAAIAHGLKLAREGADILDVGGESTRPGSGASVSAPVERDRVVPVIQGLRAGTDCLLSIDTSKATVARAALEAGADIVNDISALQFDPQMGNVVAQTGASVVLMHSRGAAGEIHDRPAYDDVLSEVTAELAEALGRARRAGIGPDRIILDPGIGFSKSAEHNLPLLGDLGLLASLGRPILVGASRKSFLGRITGRPVSERERATQAATVAAILAGAHLVRVHDVQGQVDAIRVADAIRRQRLEVAA